MTAGPEIKARPEEIADPGTIVVLNGPPRSGKSSIADVIQRTFDGIWMNLGVDVFSLQITPPSIRPGIGLRPGGPRPDIEAVLPSLYAAFYDSVAAHSRHALNVVADVGHHDDYSTSLGTLRDAAERLCGLPAFLIGIHCPIEVIMQRRRESQESDRQGRYEVGGSDGEVPEAVSRWQEAVHRPGIYDLEIDTSTVTPEQAAAMIGARLAGAPPSAFMELAH